jgi:hypothetical protein
LHNTLKKLGALPHTASSRKRLESQARNILQLLDDLPPTLCKNRPGYAKIRFCGEQAQRDGLQYFWVDTCCINKANKAELSLAIQSKFRWYHNAARCYAYLSDVSASPSQADTGVNVPAWEADFCRSEWFACGWTLQELLAPSSVDFFTRKWEKLGDRRSLLDSLYSELYICFV